MTQPTGPFAGSQFPSTLWTMVLSAGRRDSESSHLALSRLCELYWRPVYSYVRRRGYAPESAQDLTQEFFKVLLEKDLLSDVDRSLGQFRSFLMAALKHFLLNQLDYAHAKKRGGGQLVLSLDFKSAEGQYLLEPADSVTPETIFEQRWALTLLDRVLERLRRECATPHFERFKPFLLGDRGVGGYAAVGAELGMSQAAVKTAVHRLRKQYRGLLRAEILETVTSEPQVEGEIRYLLAVLQGIPLDM